MKFKIKEAREKIGFSQKELAGIIGVAPSTFNGYESGNHDPKSNLLIKIAKACHVTVDFLLGLEETENSPSADESAPEEEIVSLEESTQLLVALGFINEGQQLSDDDFAFLRNILGLLDTWFGKHE